MGEHVADTHFALHGEGTTHNAIKVRLHFGDETIDETHTMTTAMFRNLVSDRALGLSSVFASKFGTWVDAIGSSAARAEKTAFGLAAWAAM